jgi:hypothetical protein
VPGLAFEQTCTDADRDPLGVPAPSEVQRFGESAAVHRLVDFPTARQLLTDTYAPTTSVTTTVTVDGENVNGRIREVPAHPVRRKNSVAAVDKTTGVVYNSPRVIVRDPRVTPAPAASPPTAYLTSGSALGVQYVGSTVDNDTIALAIPPGTLAGGVLRTVDVYSIATYQRVTDTTDIAAVFHYDGSWTFAAEATGRTALIKTQPPTEQPVADTMVLLPR